MHWEKLGPLDCIRIGDLNARHAVVMFHGFGADASDLAPFGDMMGIGKHVQWIFPNAPMDVPVGPGMIGKAWFPIDMAALEQAMMSGRYRDFSSIRPPGLDEARQAAAACIQSLNIPMNQIILGGFSQGAMLATELTLTLLEPPAALCALSGTLLDEKHWREKLATRPALPYLMSHGGKDPLLNPEDAGRLHQLLQAAKWPGEFILFEGGHEIPPPVILKMQYLIQKTFAAKKS